MNRLFYVKFNSMRDSQSDHPLLKLLAIDQLNIKLYLEEKINHEEFAKKNLEIIRELKTFINHHGFPFKDKVNYDIYQAAFVLSLHADTEFLRKIGILFESASKIQIDLGHRAYIIDKLNLAEGKRQLYGTQFKRLPDGSIEFLPIEDEINVNKRRAELDLCSLQEYKEASQQRKSPPKK